MIKGNQYLLVAFLFIYILLLLKTMEEARVALYIYNRTSDFLCIWIICIETSSFLVGTTKNYQVLVLCDSNTLRIGNLHTFYNRHSFLLQVNDNRNIGKTNIRFLQSVRIKTKRVSIGISLSIATVEYRCQELCMLGRQTGNFCLVKGRIQ